MRPFLVEPDWLAFFPMRRVSHSSSVSPIPCVDLVTKSEATFGLNSSYMARCKVNTEFADATSTYAKHFCTALKRQAPTGSEREGRSKRPLLWGYDGLLALYRFGLSLSHVLGLLSVTSEHARAAGNDERRDALGRAD